MSAKPKTPGYESVKTGKDPGDPKEELISEAMSAIAGVLEKFGGQDEMRARAATVASGIFFFSLAAQMIQPELLEDFVNDVREMAVIPPDPKSSAAKGEGSTPSA